MYSAHLVKSRFLELKKALGKGGGPLRRSVRELNSQLVRVRKACGEEGSRTLPQPEEELTGSVAAFHAAAGEWLEEHREPSPLRGQVLERFFEAGFYLKILELVDESYIVLDSCHGSEVVTRLLCLDPARLLAERMACGRSTVLFSGTLPRWIITGIFWEGARRRCACPWHPPSHGKTCAWRWRDRSVFAIKTGRKAWSRWPGCSTP